MYGFHFFEMTRDMKKTNAGRSRPMAVTIRLLESEHLRLHEMAEGNSQTAADYIRTKITDVFEPNISSRKKLTHFNKKTSSDVRQLAQLTNEIRKLSLEVAQHSNMEILIPEIRAALISLVQFTIALDVETQK